MSYIEALDYARQLADQRTGLVPRSTEQNWRLLVCFLEVKAESQKKAALAAPAQEHATQLAGQRQEPAAWRKVERVYREYEGSAQEDTVGRLNTSYSSTKPLHATDWEPLYAAPAQAQEDARTVEPDMFWNMDEPESQHGSIEEFLSDEVSNGFLEAGAVFTMLCACKTPNITIRVTKVDHDECEAEYEVIDATIDAARAAQRGATP